MIMTVCEDMVFNILLKILKVSYGHHGGMESHFQRTNPQLTPLLGSEISPHPDSLTNPQYYTEKGFERIHNPRQLPLCNSNQNFKRCQHISWMKSKHTTDNNEK